MSKTTVPNMYEVIHVPAETGVRFFTSVDPGSYVPWHWHRAIELIFMLEGELSVNTDSTSLVLQSGDCILINSGAVHATTCTAFNKAIVLQIPVHFIEVYLPEITQLLFTLDSTNKDSVYQTKIDRVKETLQQMQIIDDIQPDGFTLRFNSLLFELLFQLYHNFSTKVFRARLTQKNKDLERLDPVLKYTAEHYTEHISISEIAKIACFQPGYFCRFFKNCMGITFLEYQNEVRLSYIYQDLIGTQDTVSQILERHGFTNYKLFRRMFAEHFGGTPRDVRRV